MMNPAGNGGLGGPGQVRWAGVGRPTGKFPFS